MRHNTALKPRFYDFIVVHLLEADDRIGYRLVEVAIEQQIKVKVCIEEDLELQYLKWVVVPRNLHEVVENDALGSSTGNTLLWLLWATAT